MATEDISCDATSFRKRYSGVRLQQGRVNTDADYNEGARIEAEDARRALIDVVGPSGSPDGGFAISNPRIKANGDMDFSVGAGTLYLGGSRLECFGEDYTQQADWLEQAPADRAPPANGRTDLVYLVAWDQPVEATEDSELFETALGGPDTATRMRRMRRILVASDVSGGDCASAWASELQTLAASYGAYDSTTALCTPDSTLTVTFDDSGATDDLCSPSIVGGYLGAENQAIRVQIVDSGHLVWGFDNASPLYRCTIGPDNRTLTLETEPRDQAHWVQAGQTVEILPWSAILPNGEKLAEISGFLTAVAGAYDPDRQTLTLKDPLPALFGQQWQARDDAAALGAPFLYLRVWPRGGDTTSDPPLAFAPGTAVRLGNSGVLVTLAGTVFVPGDHWVIAARPEDPTRVVPWDLLKGRAPTGLRRAFTPLARIHWVVNETDTAGTTVDDCRTPFQPLTRKRSCCTYTVGDGVTSRGDFTIIQDAIDRLPASGGCICVFAGTYAQDVVIDGRRNVRIEGCGPRTVITGAADGKNAAAFAILDSADIAIADLVVACGERIAMQAVDRTEAAALSLPAALVATPQAPARTLRLENIRLQDLTLIARDLPALVIGGGARIALRDSLVQIQGLASNLSLRSQAGRWPAIFSAADDVRIEDNEIVAEGATAARYEAFTRASMAVADEKITLRSRLALGGIQVAGGSERIAIRRNRITGGAGNGITLGSIAYVTAAARKSFLARADFLAMAKAWRYVTNGASLVVDDNGCIQYVPNPTPPRGSDGAPLQPVTTGSLSDIDVADNVIEGMGQSGVAAAAFFDMASDPQAIEIDRLTIERNRIANCLRVELPEVAGAFAQWFAYGAVALPLVSELRLDANRIESNGRSHLSPICGVFLLHGLGVSVCGNTIRDNGPRIASEASAQPGLRGGIFLGVIEPPPEGLGGEARPAARVEDNVVVSQEGQALVIVGARGEVSVVRNSLTTLGATALNASESTALDSQQSAGGLMSAILRLGACVVIVDIGQSSELATTGKLAGASVVAAAAAPVAAPRGAVQFDENQVLLKPASGRQTFVVSSVLLFSLDDVSAQQNQFALRSPSDLYLTDLLIVAGGLRIIGNRLSETLLRCRVSVLAVGQLVTACLNQSTHCIVVASLLGAVGLVQSGNVVVLNALAAQQNLPSPCPRNGLTRS